MVLREEIEIGGRTLVIETGRLAKQANGSTLITYGDTVVLVTATAAKEPKENIDFLPLTIEYQERFYAVGRIPGSFFRREIGRPTEKEILTCRFIDRPLRPLFADGYQHETQVIGTVLSADQQNDPDILAIIGASCSLTLSNIPFLGPIAGVRVGFMDGKYVLNPTRDQLEESRMNLIIAGSKNGVVMVEGGMGNCSEAEVLDAIFFGHEAMQPILEVQEKIRAAVGRPKMEVKPPEKNEELEKRVAEIATSDMESVITTSDKMERGDLFDALKAKVTGQLEEEFEGRSREAKEILYDLKKTMMRDRIVKDHIRIDGRKFDGIRPITCSVATLPRVHGSSLFTRGETQAMVTATLGSGEDEQRIESLYGMSFRPFMLHYNFPPYCVGEVRFMRGPSRRDIGHGALASRALKAVLPDSDKFPYTIRIVSEVMESNGSSSMATVCGGTLALMDAGVPIRKPVAGVAMGLIKDDEQIVILSDILGDEDHLGDMDFKVTGTDEGITALQMDIKIEGVSKEIMSQALDQARMGRIHILKEMEKALPEPRTEVPEHAPKIFSLQINPDRIRDIIGPGGKIIKGMTAEFGVKIDVEDSGKVSIFAPNGKVGEAVTARIKDMTEEAEIGKIYTGTVQKIVDFGAFVQILPGIDGLVHISELENRRVNKVTDVLKEGEEVRVKVLAIDQRGKIRLSRKVLLVKDE
ncbi:MAG: polyribonucleotide nucleotidyltransferase [Thermodesulfobacteriota bacterium]|nr:polyribonucleotide nucleotidyltransferase [Thermodesulfobacteriota bacterium]